MPFYMETCIKFYILLGTENKKKEENRDNCVYNESTFVPENMQGQQNAEQW